MKLLLAGGGTAGHVNPLLALASELHKRFPHSQLRVLGTAEGLETELVPAAGWPLDLIPRARLPRQLSRDWLAFPGSLAGAVHGAKRVIKQLQADAVVGFGGYVAAAAYLAAWRNCPIIVHEANHHVGWANRLGFHLASGVATSFAAVGPAHAQVTGLPLRPQVANCQRTPDTRRAARQLLGLATDQPCLLVTGGSLGAAHLNQVLAAALTPLLDAGLQIIHLTGVGKAEPALRQLAKTRPSYQIHEYFENIAVAYQAADLALCRAGAGMVAELSAVGLPSILVPLPHGNGEQMANAQPLSQAGGALVIADQALTAQWLVDQVCKLINDATALPKMAEAAERCGSRNGAERLADLVETVVARGK